MKTLLIVLVGNQSVIYVIKFIKPGVDSILDLFHLDSVLKSTLISNKVLE